MIGTPPILTDSSAGTASTTNVVTALADGSTYATDVASLRNNLATLTRNLNQLTNAVNALIAEVKA